MLPFKGKPLARSRNLQKAQFTQRKVAPQRRPVCTVRHLRGPAGPFRVFGLHAARYLAVSSITAGGVAWLVAWPTQPVPAGASSAVIASPQGVTHSNFRPEGVALPVIGW